MGLGHHDARRGPRTHGPEFRSEQDGARVSALKVGQIPARSKKGKIARAGPVERCDTRYAKVGRSEQLSFDERRDLLDRQIAWRAQDRVRGWSATAGEWLR